MASHLFKKYIGIDGGGTKTMGVIGDETGSIQAIAFGGSSNIQSKPFSDVKRVLLQLLDQLVQEANTHMSELGMVFLSLAGCGRKEDQQLVYEVIHSHLPKGVTMIVDNDALATLASGTLGEPGIVLIAGTGSIAYVLRSDGIFSRVGGWGYVLGDEGSGFDVGRKGLAAVLKEYDGRGKKTSLTERFMEKYHLSSPKELITVVYRSNKLRENIAALSKIVFREAKQGDWISEDIVNKAIHELITLVETAYRSEKSEPLPLVVSGGLFNDGFFKKKIIVELQERIKDLNILTPSIPAAAGAFLLALKHAGISLDDEKKKRLETSWGIISAGL